jgi:hypothetical protein
MPTPATTTFSDIVYLLLSFFKQMNALAIRTLHCVSHGRVDAQAWFKRRFSGNR